MEQQPHIDVLLDRVFKGTATQAEQRLVREWLFALDLSDAAERNGDMTAAKIAMLKRIVGAEQEHGETVKTTAPRGRFYVLKRLTRAAALLAGIVLLGSLLLHFISGERPPSNTLAEEWVTIHAADNIQYITLPDKSRIWLNAHSELRYSKNSFKVSNRHIWLKGEAFFEVEKDTSKPFIVHADAIATRVLGTGFNVTAYQQDDAIRVTLVHGKVSVKQERDNRTVLLEPHQQLQYSRARNDWGIVPFPVNPAKNWMSGGLAFEEVPLTEVLDDIGHRFNRKILYNRSQLKDKKVTARFDARKDLAFILQSILFVHNLDFRTENTTVRIFNH